MSINENLLLRYQYCRATGPWNSRNNWQKRPRQRRTIQAVHSCRVGTDPQPQPYTWNALRLAAYTSQQNQQQQLAVHTHTHVAVYTANIGNFWTILFVKMNIFKKEKNWSNFAKFCPISHFHVSTILWQQSTQVTGVLEFRYRNFFFHFNNFFFILIFF